jgi:hypothetical protein
MSQTQRVLNRLRKIADEIDREAGQCDRPGQVIRLKRHAEEIRNLADDIGDD